jgi:hypothetical protein
MCYFNELTYITLLVDISTPFQESLDGIGVTGLSF